MAIFHVAGPAHLYPAVGPGGAFRYLGTSEQGLDIEIQPFIEPVVNDLSGRAPMERSHLGEQGLVSGDVNRYNTRVLAACMSRPNSQGTRGNEAFGSIGALLLTEALAYKLVVTTPYGSKPVYAANGDPTCFQFLATVMVGPDHVPLGTRYTKVRCIWAATSVFNIKDGSFTLYNHTLPAGLPPID